MSDSTDTSCIAGVYICMATSTTDKPHHPMSAQGENSDQWHWISTYPSKTAVCSTTGVQSSAVADQQVVP